MMWFGCNQNHYPEMAASVPMTMVRSFKGLTPTWPTMPDGLPALLSIRPPYAQLMAAKCDAEITALLQSAPPGSLLTAWHEANQAHLTALQARQIHSYMLALCKQVAPHIPYGAVTTQGAGPQWVIPGLGFYGIDVYNLRRGRTNPVATLNKWRDRYPPGPRIVAETNSMHPGQRPAWFQAVYDWLKANDGMAMLTFWNPTGPLSGPWLPTDTATINVLQAIAADAASPPSAV